MIRPLKPCSARCTGWIVARVLGISLVTHCPRCWSGEILRPEPSYYHRSKPCREQTGPKSTKQ